MDEIDEKYQNHGKYFSLPVVTNLSKKGQNLYWQIFIGLVTSDTPKDFAEGRNPEDLLILSSPILDMYYNNSKMDQKLKGYKITATWRDGGKPILKTATFITKGKNEIKDSRTNTWTQTAKDALSDYNKKNKPNEHQNLLAPMLASGNATPMSEILGEATKIWEKYPNDIRTQPKFDGHRLLVKMDRQSEPHIYPYARSRDPSHISNELMRELEKIYETIFRFAPNHDDIIYLDGEYYLHGLPLQTISSAVRSEAQSELKSSLQYHVFDIVITNQSGTISGEDSRTRLWKIYQLSQAYHMNLVKFVESYKPLCPKDIYDQYVEKTNQEYEGIIIRVSSKKYESGRSQFMIKMKGLFREEFRIVGFAEGVGKHAGLIIFKCALTEQSIERARQHMNDKGIPVTDFDIANPKDVYFNVTPKMDEAERKKMFENGDSYVGSLLTVEFQDWSNGFKPLRPVGIAIYHP